MNLNLDDNEILRLREEGLTYQKIANIMGCSKKTIIDHMKKMNKPEEKREYTKGFNKKKNIPLEAIIALHKEGKSDGEIANELGCSRSNVTQRLNNAGYINRKAKKDKIEVRNKISNSLKGRMLGENNPNYKGYSEEIELARGLFKALSKEMIRNSGYYCHICRKKSQKYHVHHIKPFSIIVRDFINTNYSGNIETFTEELINNCPEFWNKDNLVVCCPDCHKKIHYTDNPDLSPYRWERATTISEESRVK